VSRPLVCGNRVKSQKRIPPGPAGKKPATASGAIGSLPSLGKVGSSSVAHARVKIGNTGSRGPSLTNTDLPLASWPVTTRRTIRLTSARW
jgi:hypothetical protein